MTEIKKIYEKEIRGLKCKTVYIVQRSMNEFYIAFRKPYKKEEYQLHNYNEELKTFMSLDTAARLLRYHCLRDIRIQML